MINLGICKKHYYFKLIKNPYFEDKFLDWGEKIYENVQFNAVRVRLICDKRSTELMVTLLFVDLPARSTAHFRFIILCIKAV